MNKLKQEAQQKYKNYVSELNNEIVNRVNSLYKKELWNIDHRATETILSIISNREPIGSHTYDIKIVADLFKDTKIILENKLDHLSLEMKKEYYWLAWEIERGIKYVDKEHGTS